MRYWPPQVLRPAGLGVVQGQAGRLHQGRRELWGPAALPAALQTTTLTVRGPDAALPQVKRKIDYYASSKDVCTFLNDVPDGDDPRAPRTGPSGRGRGPPWCGPPSPAPGGRLRSCRRRRRRRWTGRAGGGAGSRARGPTGGSGSSSPRSHCGCAKMHWGSLSTSYLAALSMCVGEMSSRKTFFVPTSISVSFVGAKKSDTNCSSSFQNTVTKHAMYGRGENLATVDVLFSMPVDYSSLRSVQAISWTIMWSVFQVRRRIFLMKHFFGGGLDRLFSLFVCAGGQIPWSRAESNNRHRCCLVRKWISRYLIAFRMWHWNTNKIELRYYHFTHNPFLCVQI